MKKVFFLLSLLQLSLVAASQSPANQQQRNKHGYAEIVSVAYMLMSPASGDKIHNVGVKAGGGFYPINDMTRLGIEIGVQSSTNKLQIGSFGYKQEQNGRVTTYSDGVIKHEMTFVPILINWSFEFGQQIMFRVGPTIGLMPLSSKNSFEPKVDDSEDYVVKQVKAPFVYGLNAEISITMTDIIKLNLGYKYLRLTPFNLEHDNKGNNAIEYNSSITEMKLTGHQIAAGILITF
jgi:hypothetical protein